MTGLSKQVAVPSLVRVKPGALGRLGIYIEGLGARLPVLFVSAGLPAEFLEIVDAVLPPGTARYEVASTERAALLRPGQTPA